MIKYIIAIILGWAIGWAIGWIGIIDALQDEIKSLKAENARLKKEAKKEPSTVEALSALQAKCRRTRYAQKCPYECERCLRLYCSESTTLPCNIADSVLNYQGGVEISKAIEQKTNEYKEANS